MFFFLFFLKTNPLLKPAEQEGVATLTAANSDASGSTARVLEPVARR